MFTFKNDEFDYAHKLDYASSPEDEYDKHMHYFNEIVFFVDGDIDYTVEEQTRHLKPGDIIFIRPGKYHFASVNRTVSYERYVIKFPETLINDYLREKLNDIDPFIINTKNEQYIFKAMDKFSELFKGEDLELLFISKTLELLVLLANEANKKSEMEDSSIVTTIINYIDKNIYLNLSLEKMAKDLNYSKSYLSNSFRNKMKCPLMQYIKSKKIMAAHSLIGQGYKPSEVCETLGFQDYSTFYRSYMRVFKTPPSKNNK